MQVAQHPKTSRSQNHICPFCCAEIKTKLYYKDSLYFFWQLKKNTKQNKRGDKVSFINFIWTIMVLLICWSALCSNWSCTEIQGNNACLTKGCSAWYHLSVHYRSCPYSGFPRLHFHNFSSLQLESFRI